MSDEPENLVLRYLRSMDGRLDRMERTQQEMLGRLGSLERDFAGVKTDLAGINLRLDNVNYRLDRIERRLDLTEDARLGTR
jgi:hypothetical protein